MAVYNVRFQIGSYVADVGCWKWGYTDTTEYLERRHETAGYGHIFRTKIGVTRRVLTITFVESDAVIELIRTLSMLVYRTMEPVVFYQDLADILTLLPLEWQTVISRQVIVENRAGIELTVMEKL